MRYELFLAMRYLGGLRREQPFLSVIAAISICGVAVGVAALLVVLGVMSGFDADLQAKIVGSNPHLVVEAEGGIADSEALMGKLSEIPQVKAAAPFLQTQVILRHRGEATGVLLRGIDSEREAQVTTIAQRASQEGSWPLAPGTILVGSELARRWGLAPGDRLTVMGGKKVAPREWIVAGSFTTGMYEYDLNLVLAPIGSVQELLETPGFVTGIGIRLDDPMAAALAKETLQRRLGYPYWVASWMDLNRSLFAALKLEKVRCL
jgi:lipoprotein-releasing system permease protein